MEGNYYNGPPGTPLAYIPTGYDPYAPTQQQPPPTPVQPFSAPNSAAGPASPPMPMPSTPIAFPLDPTRYYLLGQLEYYLSPQNMAQDIFLRRHVREFFFSSFPTRVLINS
jgi:la-related protein 1